MAFGKQGSINKENQKKLQEERQAALFGGKTPSDEIQFPKNTLVNMPIDLIDVHPDNKEVFEVKDIPQLANQIKRVGYDISKPLTLYEKEDGRYEIISGERRFTAATMAGLKVIPSIIKKDTLEADKAGELVDSNFFDREKSYLEKARAMAYWKDNYLIPKEGPDNADEKTCEHFNIKMGTLSNYWKILKLSTELQELCFNPNFPASLLAILNVQAFSLDEQKELYEEIKKNTNLEDENWKMSSKQLGDIIDLFKKKKAYRENLERNKKLLFENELENEIDNEKNVTSSFKLESIDQFEKAINQPMLKELSVKGTKPAENLKTATKTTEVNESDKNKDEYKSFGVEHDQMPIIKKKDLSKVLLIINNQLQSINALDYEVEDVIQTEQIIAAAMKKLKELKDNIREIQE